MALARQPFLARMQRFIIIELLIHHLDTIRHLMGPMVVLGCRTNRLSADVVGEDMAAFEMTIRLQEEGVFANPVVSPAVPAGRAMMRTSYMASHSTEQLERALDVFARIGNAVTVTVDPRTALDDEIGRASCRERV